jgi:mannose-6-phosphate isomerase-like protein (cupin superfamily)
MSISRSPSDAFDFTSTYVHLEDGPGAVRLCVGDDFWERIESRTDLHEGRLVSGFHFTEDWKTWEVHPNGDEIVYLLSGAMDLVLQEAEGERVVKLRGRAACVVPRGAWHRAIVHAPSDALFITRGAGTQHRPI